MSQAWEQWSPYSKTGGVASGCPAKNNVSPFPQLFGQRRSLLGGSVPFHKIFSWDDADPLHFLGDACFSPCTSTATCSGGGRRNSGRGAVRGRCFSRAIWKNTSLWNLGPGLFPEPQVALKGRQRFLCFEACLLSMIIRSDGGHSFPEGWDDSNHQRPCAERSICCSSWILVLVDWGGGLSLLILFLQGCIGWFPLLVWQRLACRLLSFCNNFRVTILLAWQIARLPPSQSWNRHWAVPEHRELTSFLSCGDWDWILGKQIVNC